MFFQEGINYSAEFEGLFSNTVTGLPEGKRPDGSYVRKHSPKWEAGDEETDHWFVYILQFSDKTYYVGHTRDLRVRLTEHRDNKTKGTRNKSFELVWFTTVYSREFAETLEADLKETRDQNERFLRGMILEFRDCVKEMDIFNT